MKKFLSLILAFAMVMSVSGVAMAEWSGTGTGVENDPYIVYNETELLDAIAETGIYIKLGASFSVTDGTTIVIPSGRTIVLDLAGYTISQTQTEQGKSLFKNKGTFTVKDSEGDGKITSTFTGTPDSNFSIGNYTITNAGTMTVNGGTIANDTAAMSHMRDAIDNNSTEGNAILTINGGKVVSDTYIAIRQYANSASYENSVTINDGTVEGGERGIWVHLPGSDSTKTKKASLEVTGGTITSNDSDYNLAVYVYGYGDSVKDLVIDISGGTFNGDVALYSKSGLGDLQEDNLQVTGGDFNGDYGIYDYSSSGSGYENQKIEFGFVSGGTFNGVLDEHIIADDALVAEVSDGTDTVYAFGEASIKEAANEDGVTKVTVTKGTVNFDAGDVPAGVTIAENGGEAQVNGEDVEGETEMPAVTYTVNVVASPSDASWGTVTGGGTYEAGTEVTLKATPKDGFFFDEWLDENGAHVSNNNPFVIDALDKDYTLVAIFAPEVAEDPTVTYTIKFDGNGGTGSVDDISITANAGESAEFTFPENGFTYEGYTFTGWCVNKDGNNIVHQPGETALTSTSLVFYAQWEEVEEEPQPDPKPSHGSHITVKYEGGNRFSTNKSAVPTSVEIDGVPVSFVGDGRSFTVSCIEPGNHWITVRWHSTSVTTNFTADASVVCMPNGIPKTGDVSVMAYALMAVIAAAGVMRKK